MDRRAAGSPLVPQNDTKLGYQADPFSLIYGAEEVILTRIITDNDTQFTSRAFMQYVHALGSKVSFASVAHPRNNGQAERANA